MGGGQPPKTIIYLQEIMDIKDFVVKNWENAKALSTLLGAEFNKTEEFHFGFVPTEQAKIEVTNGKISRITTWSGLGWSARYGYGDPIVDIGDRCLLTSLADYRTKLPPGSRGKSLYTHLGVSNMIYSFLSKEFNEKVGINPDFSYEREYEHNTVDFYIRKGVLVVEEVEHCYEDENLVKEVKIILNKGDHIIASSIGGLTLIQLTKMGVKVSLLNSELVKLPPEQQTEDIKADIIYSLVSLNDND